MQSQIFCVSPTLSILYSFLDEYAIKKNKTYIYNKYTFKKAEYNQGIKKFCDTISPFYYESKKKYITRTQTYKTFATILRQICRYHKISFTSKIKYNKSKHEMDYHIDS